MEQPILNAQSVPSVAPSREIFIVDDNEDWRDILAGILELEGYRVTGFSEGKSFLKEAQTRVPICVFLDVVMPGPSGLELLKKLKESGYAAPIFLISARADAPVILEGMSNGALGFIEKPFDPYTAVLRVRDAVEIWAHRAQNGVVSALKAAQFPNEVRLTNRECDVLAQIVANASNAEIAKNLGINRQVATNYRSKIMKKLSAKNTAELVSMALVQVEQARKDLIVNPLRCH